MHKLIIICLVLFPSCVTQKEVDYNLPVGMTKDVESYFVAKFNKGKILYTQVCADCHNKPVNGKKIVPDFTPAQLDSYLHNFRLKNKEHAENLTTKTVSEEELDYILYYLTYKKKNQVQ